MISIEVDREGWDRTVPKESRKSSTVLFAPWTIRSSARLARTRGQVLARCGHRKSRTRNVIPVEGGETRRKNKRDCHRACGRLDRPLVPSCPLRSLVPVVIAAAEDDRLDVFLPDSRDQTAHSWADRRGTVCRCETCRPPRTRTTGRGYVWKTTVARVHRPFSRMAFFWLITNTISGVVTTAPSRTPLSLSAVARARVRDCVACVRALRRAALRVCVSKYVRACMRAIRDVAPPFFPDRSRVHRETAWCSRTWSQSRFRVESSFDRLQGVPDIPDTPLTDTPPVRDSTNESPLLPVHQLIGWRRKLYSREANSSQLRGVMKLSVLIDFSWWEFISMEF